MVTKTENSAPNNQPQVPDNLRHFRAAENKTTPLNWIKPSDLNPRKHFDDEALQELAESIKEHGVLQPIVIRPDPKDTHYAPSNFVIVAGERRYRAAQLAGLTVIPTVIRYDIDDAAHLRLALVENLQRQDLDPMDEAEGYAQLNRVCGLKQTEIAAAVKRSQPVIANRMRLLELPADVQQTIREKKLTPSHGIALCRYKDFPKVAEKLATLAVENNRTSKYLEQGIGDVEATELSKAHLIHRFSYDEHSIYDQCRKQCPYGAFESAGYQGLCLHPPCFREKNKERKAAAQKQLEQDKAEGKVSVEDLKSGSYIEFGYNHGVPQGCRSDCEKRRQAKSRYNTSATLCLDPSCYKTLHNAEVKAAADERSEKADRLRQKTHLAIGSLTQVTSREIALLATRELRHISLKAMATLIESHAPELVGLNLDDLVPSDLAATLIQVPAVRLLHLLLAIRSEGEAYKMVNGWANDDVILWYLGLEEKEKTQP